MTISVKSRTAVALSGLSFIRQLPDSCGWQTPNVARQILGFGGRACRPTANQV
jgi:hypothetical protein